MNGSQLVKRVRSLTRDLNASVFREEHIIEFINEGIERVKQVIPYLDAMNEVSILEDEVAYLPKAYHHILAVYSASRCFFQDERHYQATTLMNEFETKVQELLFELESGNVQIKDELGFPVELEVHDTEYVVDTYFNRKRGG